MATVRRRGAVRRAGHIVRGRPDPADLHRAARIFAGLGHPARIQLLCAVADSGSATQKDLLDQFGWPQSTMARHLGALRDRGLLRATRQGKHTILALNGTVTPQLLAAVCQWIHPDTHERFAKGLTGDRERAR